LLGQASHFVWCNRSKESLTLDVEQQQAQDILRQLLEKAEFSCRTWRPMRRRD